MPVPLEALRVGTDRARTSPATSSTCSTYLFGEVLDGRNAHLTDGVQRALGRQPRDFRDYARDAAATGIWHPVVAQSDAA